MNRLARRRISPSSASLSLHSWQAFSSEPAHWPPSLSAPIRGELNFAPPCAARTSRISIVAASRSPSQRQPPQSPSPRVSRREGDGGMSEREMGGVLCVSLWATVALGALPRLRASRGLGSRPGRATCTDYLCALQLCTLRCRKSQNSPPLRHTRTSYLGTARSGPDRLVLRSSSAALDHNTSPRPIGRRSTCCKWRVGVKVEAASEVKTASEVER